VAVRGDIMPRHLDLLDVVPDLGENEECEDRVPLSISMATKRVWWQVMRFYIAPWPYST
jgi:hypothetical protein